MSYPGKDTNVDKVLSGDETFKTVKGMGSGNAPEDAEYVVKSSNAVLTAERVLTDNASITADWSVAGQVKLSRAALTGDVTASANANALTIANDAVTYAKMQNVSAASRLLGRGSAAGSGDPEEISLGSGVTMTGTTLSATGSGGTVTSIGLIMPTAVFDVSGSPVTGSGDITVTFDTQTANIVFAGPSSGGAATPTFRSLVTADLANDLVTYAKIQNVSATSRVLGRKTAGSGDTEECTLSEVLDFVGSAAQGDVLYRGAATWTRLGAGTSGQVLTTGGAGANPSWTTSTAPTVIVQAFDESSSITGLSASSYLVSSLAANSTYAFEFYIRWQSAATTTGIAFSIDGPASPTFIGYHIEIQTSGSSNFDVWATAYNDNTPSNSIDAANVDRFARVSGMVRTASDVSALFELRFASEVAASAVTLKARSFCILTRVE